MGLTSNGHKKNLRGSSVFIAGKIHPSKPKKRANSTFYAQLNFFYRPAVSEAGESCSHPPPERLKYPRKPNKLSKQDKEKKSRSNKMNDTNTSSSAKRLHVTRDLTRRRLLGLAKEFNRWTVQQDARIPTLQPTTSDNPIFFFFKSPQSPAEPQSGADRVTLGRDPEPPFTNSSTGTMHGLIMSHGASLFSLSVIMRFLFFFFCKNLQELLFYS